jgi:hypothetical protein
MFKLSSFSYLTASPLIKGQIGCPEMSVSSWQTTPCNFLIINKLDTLNSQIYFGMKLYMFRTVPLSIIRCFLLSTQQWYMSYRFADSLHASCQQTCMIYTTAVSTVKNSWWWTEELSETCRVLFQNKFEKLVQLVGFIIRNLSRCTVTWASNTPCNIPKEQSFTYKAGKTWNGAEVLVYSGRLNCCSWFLFFSKFQHL